MKIALLLVGAARRLNISGSVVQHLCDQYQSKVLFPEDMFQTNHKLQYLQKKVL